MGGGFFPYSGLEDISSRYHQEICQRCISKGVFLLVQSYRFYSTIHCTKSLFTNRDVNVMGMRRERNIPNIFFRILWCLLFPRVLCATLIIMIICWLIFDTTKRGSRQLISFGGLVMYVLLMLIFSKYPTRVSIYSIMDLLRFFLFCV